ncbi:UNVERIFIED_CONTAM: hypothetical protein Sradi_1546000 [Sesamum radiatum]|uniref:Uncharacterized protein n=1 Tax=Sesamum radiatum TaxID=300843 RepID=A0AAW2U8K1_SESRA
MPLEDIVKTLALSTQQFQQETRSSIQNLESQISQLASSVSRLESQGKLPSQTIINPKQNASAIVLRSGKELSSESGTMRGHARGKIRNRARNSSKQAEKPDQVDNDTSKVLVTKPPFPERFSKSKKEEEEKEIFETFRKGRGKHSLIDAIKQIPRYAKFFKELCTNKGKLKGNERVNMGENVSQFSNKNYLLSARIQVLEEYMALDPSIGESIFELEALPPLHLNLAFIELPQSHTKLLPSILQTPTLELKELPKHLKYAYLGENETLPVIISSKLSTLEEEKLIRVLREFREAIGWTIADIKGFKPFHMHA